MSYEFLRVVWYALLGILLTGYAVLDGFDLGVGALHLFARGDENRRILLNAIGPVWDGNEVWLVAGGGAMFAAFPEVYAAVFSGFYLVFILLLFGLIFRAAAIEFRGRLPQSWWRRSWDASFSASSILSSFLIGVAFGNVIYGIPLNAAHQFSGSFFSLFSPYPALMGITTVALFAMHGSIFVILKTEGDLHANAREWGRNCLIFFILCYVVLTMATLLYVPHMAAPFRTHPYLFAIPAVGLLFIANIPREIFHGRDFSAFVSSCLAIVFLMGLVGIGLYPCMVYSNPGPQNSLTLFNSASSPATLTVMLIVAAIGIPLVVSYTAGVYWIFRGKVRLDPHSY